MKRGEWHEAARTLARVRPELSAREIAETFGVTKSAVWKALNPGRCVEDADAARERKRRLYARPCVDCGAELRINGKAEADRRSGRCMKCATAATREMDPGLRMDRHNGMHGLTYSDNFIFWCLRCAATGGRVTKKGYDAWRDGREGIPSSCLIMWRFDRWAVAVHAAGLEAGRTNRTYKRTTTDDCLRAVREVADELGRFPTYREYERAARDRGLPSAVLVRIRFDNSWRSVFDAYQSERLAVAA